MTGRAATTVLDPPIEAYQQRPTLTGQPLAPPSVPRLLLLRAHAALAALVGWQFYADWSYYQRAMTKAYPFRIACYRGHSGGMIDPNLRANNAVALPWNRIAMVIVYVVYLPGKNAQILADLKSVFGPVCPAKVVFRIDLERGAGFAGPGDHSAGANQLAQMLADYRGTAVGHDQARAELGIDGYANKYDKIDGWPHPLSWLTKWAIAKYSTAAPDITWYSWQYAGGDPRWGSPSGFPRVCAPFGSVIDMNAIHKPLADVLLDYGVTSTSTGIDMASEFKNDSARDQYVDARVAAYLDSAKGRTVVDRIVARLGGPIENMVAAGIYSALTGDVRGRFRRWTVTRHPRMVGAAKKLRAAMKTAGSK